jgi:hypothetical protein
MPSYVNDTIPVCFEYAPLSTLEKFFKNPYSKPTTHCGVHFQPIPAELRTVQSLRDVELCE